MRKLIENGHLFLAQPPLYRLTKGAKTEYALDDAQNDELLRTAFNGAGKVEVSRFKGLGEVQSVDLREPTTDPAKLGLLKVDLPTAVGAGRTAAGPRDVV